MFGMELTLNAVPSTVQIPVFFPWHRFQSHSRDQAIQKGFLCEMQAFYVKCMGRYTIGIIMSIGIIICNFEVVKKL